VDRRGAARGAGTGPSTKGTVRSKEDKFAAALKGHDLKAALSRVGRTNDMLPPREDDKVAGRIADRFTTALAAQIATGDYEPSRGAVVSVPKTRFATRPAMLLRLEDRIVFEALVEPMRERIERYLISNEAVLWPRGLATEKRWDEFENAPLQQGGGYVALADVAGFYESVDHHRLVAELLRAGAEPNLVRALEDFLHDVMGGRRGLPQGIATSDPLATLYLAEVDAAVRRSGLPYVRHGDDMRISVATFAEGRKALSILEEALRRAGLMVNSSKVKVLKLSTYAGHLADLQSAQNNFRERMAQARREAIKKGESDKLEELLEKAGVDDETQWGWGYRGLDVDDVLELLQEHIAPSVTEVIEEMFRDAMTRRPGTPNALQREIWHARVVYCLRRLAAARSAAGIPYSADLLIVFPEETQNVCSYLLSVIDQSPSEVVRAVEFVISRAGFLLGWQYGWLFRVLSRAATKADAVTVSHARTVMTTESDWLARIEASRLVALRGGMTGAQANLLFNQAPDAYRTDIIAIAAARQSKERWAATFLEGARQDPINAVVLDGIRSRRAEG